MSTPSSRKTVQVGLSPLTKDTHVGDWSLSASFSLQVYSIGVYTLKWSTTRTSQSKFIRSSWMPCSSIHTKIGTNHTLLGVQPVRYSKFATISSFLRFKWRAMLKWTPLVVVESFSTQPTSNYWWGWVSSVQHRVSTQISERPSWQTSSDRGMVYHILSPRELGLPQTSVIDTHCW